MIFLDLFSNFKWARYSPYLIEEWIENLVLQVGHFW